MASLGGWFGDGGVGRFGDPDTPDTQPGLSPTEETELRIRISHQVASALQPDPRPGRGGDTCPGSTVDGSWSSLLSYVGVPFVSTGVRVGSSSFVTPHHVPPLQQGVLPEVELSDFDPYLRRSRIGSSAYRYKKGVDDTSDTSASETGDEPAGCSFVEDPGFSSPETAGASRRDDAPGDDSWRDVPSLFFQEQFSLQDPEVFHTVCGDAFVCDPMFANLNNGAQAALVSRRYELRLHQHEHISDADADKLCEERCAESALQSRLARHLDVVETLLIHKVERKQNQFIAAALLINDLVDAVEKAQVVCAKARACTRSACAISASCANSITAKQANRRNVQRVYETCLALQDIKNARHDLHLLVAAEEHTGALQACQEVRRIKSNAGSLLCDIQCVGVTLDASLREIEKACGESICAQWIDAARVPFGATASARGGGAPSNESCLAIVGAAARTKGLHPPSAGEWDLEDDSKDTWDDPLDTRQGRVFASPRSLDRPHDWGESRNGLGPAEGSVCDAAQELFPRLTRALLASGASSHEYDSHASVGNGGVAGDAIRQWGEAAAKDVEFAMRRALRAALKAAGVCKVGDGFEKRKNSALPDVVHVRVLETVAAAAHEHLARCAMCVSWVTVAVGSGTATGVGVSLGVPSNHVAAAASNGASVSGVANSDFSSEFGDFQLDLRDANVLALLSHAVATASKLPPTRRAAIGSAALHAARLIADAASKTFAAFTEQQAPDETGLGLGLKSVMTNCPYVEFGDHPAAEVWSWRSVQKHRALVDVIVLFQRKTESLGRRKCLSLRGAATNVSKAWLANRSAAATKRLHEELALETWEPAGSVDGETADAILALFELAGFERPPKGNVPPEQSEESSPTLLAPDPGFEFDLAMADADDDTQKKQNLIWQRVALPTKSSLWLARLVNEFIALVKQSLDLAPDVRRRILEITRAFNARSCRLVLGAEATKDCDGTFDGDKNKNKLKSITAKHLAVTHRSLRFVQGVVLPGAAHCLLCLMPSQARKEALETETRRVKTDLDTHCFEIRQKLVAIMRERGDARAGELKAIPDARQDEPFSSETLVTEITNSIAKELATIARVVGDGLTRKDAGAVFGEIARAFDETFADALKEKDLPEKNANDAARAIALALGELTSLDGTEAAPRLSSMGGGRE